MGYKVMRRSKMEIYIDILKALACHGRLKLTHIMYKANVSCSALKESLDLLIQQDLVKERTLNKKRVVYTITGKGLSALKNVWEINNVLQTIPELDIPAVTLVGRGRSFGEDLH